LISFRRIRQIEPGTVVLLWLEADALRGSPLFLQDVQVAPVQERLGSEPRVISWHSRLCFMATLRCSACRDRRPSYRC